MKNSVEIKNKSTVLLRVHLENGYIMNVPVHVDCDVTESYNHVSVCVPYDDTVALLDSENDFKLSFLVPSNGIFLYMKETISVWGEVTKEKDVAKYLEEPELKYGFKKGGF